jgi:hypothetical protein
MDSVNTFRSDWKYVKHFLSSENSFHVLWYCFWTNPLIPIFQWILTSVPPIITAICGIRQELREQTENIAPHSFRQSICSKWHRSVRTRQSNIKWRIDLSWISQGVQACTLLGEGGANWYYIHQTHNKKYSEDVFAYLWTHLALILSPCTPICWYDTALLMVTHLGRVNWLRDHQHGGCVNWWRWGWSRRGSRTTAAVGPRGPGPRIVI